MSDDAKGEPTPLSTKVPHVLYAIVPAMADDASLIHMNGERQLFLTGAYDDDLLWEDCDYDGLRGLLVFEGVCHHRLAAWDSATDDERDIWCDMHDVQLGSFDSWVVGKWRHMTHAEAVSLGLLAEPSK